MVTRVASFGRSQALIAQLMVAQQRAQQSLVQSSTGRKADDYQGYGIDASRLISANSYLATTQQGIDSATQLKTTLDAQQLAVSQLRTDLQKLTKSLSSNIAGNTATGLITNLNTSLSAMFSTLNASQNGSYLLAGTRSNAAPVVATAGTSTGLMALTNGNAAFDQIGRALTVTIAGGGTVSFGPLARDLGAPIFQVLQNIYKYNAGTYTGVGGPGTALTGDLTTAQSTFLTSQLSLLYEADATALDLSVRGGAVVNQVADMITRLSAQKTAAAKFLGEIQDIDFAGAASRLNDDRAAVDVATKVLASVDKSNLLNYL